MAIVFPAWLSKSLDAYRRLGDQPFLLLALLLALNAIARPYSNCIHDARLYSLQVLNQAEDGAFADDVFLRYGSQDKFSAFSRFVGPIAATVGLRAAFVGLYLVFNALLIWGLFRLVRRLFPDPIVSTSALIFLVTMNLYYGGHRIFTVHEPFFTPRLIGAALVLHGLERLVAHRFVASFFLLAAALLIHPLMACGGVLVWLGYVLHLCLSRRVFFVLLAASCILGVAILSIPAIAFRLFGHMDGEWHELIRLSVLYNYPAAWSYGDWFNHLLAFGLSIAAVVWLYRDDPIRARFFLIVTLASVIGLATTIFASESEYALLFQGQPYRAVWILKVMQIPLAFVLLQRLNQLASIPARLAALALLTFFMMTTHSTNEFAIYAFALAIAAFLCRMKDDPAPSDWWWPAGIYTLCLGAIGWTLYSWWFLVTERETILGQFEQTEFIRLFGQCTPAAVWLLAVLLLVGCIHSSRQYATLAGSCLAIALAAPLLTFALDANADARNRFTRYGADISFARDAIDQRKRESTRVPKVYSSLGRVEFVWLDLHATSYYDGVQTAGVMFNRQTATEMHRRIALVRKFEMDRLNKEAVFMEPGGKAIVERLLGVPFNGPAATADDLIRLCQDPDLDYVVVPHEFPGLYSATNGRIYVYECYKVKNAGSSSSARADASATKSPVVQRER
jgi:hypothetical protein